MSEGYSCSRQGGCNRSDCGTGLARSCKNKQILNAGDMNETTYTESEVQVILEMIVLDLKILYSQCDDDHHVTKNNIIEIVKHQQDRLKGN